MSMRFSEFRKYARNKDLRLSVSWDDLHWYYPNLKEEPNVGERVYRKGQRQPMVVEDRCSVLKDNGYWHVQPIGYFWNGASVYIVCPYCKNVHVHGNSNGHRTPHCDPGVNSNKGYFVDGADAVVKNSRRNFAPVSIAQNCE